MSKQLIVSLIILKVICLSGAIDFNLFPALFDFESTKVSVDCKTELSTGERLCIKANLKKWTDNGLIPSIEEGERNGDELFTNEMYDKYHCCGSWDLTQCIYRFAKLKCSTNDSEIISETVTKLNNHLAENLCSNYPRHSNKCKHTPVKDPRKIFGTDFADKFNSFKRIPGLSQTCNRALESAKKQCTANAIDYWLKSDLMDEILEDDLDSLEVESVITNIQCCAVWDGMDCIMDTLRAECDIDEELMDDVSVLIDNIVTKSICKNYPRNSINCEHY